MRTVFDKLVVATHNPGKLAEIRTLLEPRGITLISAADAELHAPEETGTTFVENATIKARTAAEATGLAALSDDSGLAVDALGGAPGVYSADWGGPNKDFAGAMTRVLAALSVRTDAPRTAAFVSVLALAVPGRPVETFAGTVTGRIAHRPRGTGFGYDPIFIPDEGDGRTFGEMTREEKAGGAAPLSHRARAIAAFVAALDRADA